MASHPSDAIEVFYSYSHKDEELRDQLENHLTMLKRDGVIEGWHDRRISAGREWEGQIDAHLNSADIILLLISSDFLASAYCYDIEVKRAMERHEAGEARVIPIILRACDWKTALFGKLQALPTDVKPVRKWEDPDDAFLDIAQGIRKAAAEVSTGRNSSIPPTVEKPHPTPSLNIPDVLRVDFVARSDGEGNDLIGRLTDELAPHKRRLIALWGAGGVGKTALAAEAARALSVDFAQRVVWVSADGREDFSLSSLLDEIARQLKYDELRKLALEPKKEQVREVVAAAPTLVVLDNFETITPEEGRLCADWLAQPALCSSLITTRDRVEAAARNVTIRPMSSEEARTYLRRLISQVHEPRAFEGLDYDRVIATADANPLVLQWIVGQIDLAQSPQEVLDELKQGEGTAAERVFDRSFNLKQMDNGGRAVLLALSLFVPGAKRKGLAEVAGLGKEKDRKRFKDAVKTLSALWLIRATDASQRLAVEGLTRELAKARLSRDPRATAFRQRFVARFRHYAEANSRPTIEHLNSIEDEKDNVLSALDVASELKDWNSLMRMSNAIQEFLVMRGFWDEAIRTGEQGLAVARNSSSEQWIVVFTRNLAISYQDRGDSLGAYRLCGESLEISKRLGNQQGIAASLHQLATLAQDRGELDEAQRLYEECLDIDKKCGNQQGIAASQYQLANLAKNRGELDEARHLYEECLEISKRLDDQRGISASQHQLATLAQGRGELDEARRLYEDSLEISKRLGDQRGIADSLHQLATLAQDRGELDEAQRLYEESLEIEKGLGNQRGISASQHQLATLAQGRGELDEARRLYEDSLEISKRLGDQRGIANSLLTLGDLMQEQGDIPEARRLCEESLEIFTKLGDQRGIAFNLHQLGSANLAEGQLEPAETLFNQSLIILRKLGDKNNIAECLESLGSLRGEQDAFEAAREFYSEALQLAEVLGAKFRVASVKRSLGLLAGKENEKGKAKELLREALTAFEELNSYKADATRRDLEKLEGEGF